MFEKLAQELLGLESKRNTFDPSHFGDPIAIQIDWTPAKGGGANFRTHKLVKVNSNRLEFRASIGAKVFYLIFLLAGIGAITNLSPSKLPPSGFSFNMALVFVIGLVFVIAGSCMLYFGTAPIVFDKQKGFFWKGRKTPDKVFGKKAVKYFAELEKIHALQIISEYCSGNKSSYHSYELNLVLENGNRINVVDHGNQNKLQEDAETLAAFLEKPVWDAT